MTDTDAKAAAQWMLDQLKTRRDLWQMDAAEHTKKHFDEGLTYMNANDNLAIG